jgi:hypothetical protein
VIFQTYKKVVLRNFHSFAQLLWLLSTSLLAPRTKKGKKKWRKKTTQTFVIVMHNCQTLVILAHNYWPSDHLWLSWSMTMV